MLPAFAIEHVQATADRGEIRLRGILSFAEAGPLWTELRRLETTASRGQTLDFEMSQVQRIDGGAMGLLACLRAELQRRGVKAGVVAAGAGGPGDIHLYVGRDTDPALEPARPLQSPHPLGRATPRH